MGIEVSHNDLFHWRRLATQRLQACQHTLLVVLIISATFDTGSLKNWQRSLLAFITFLTISLRWRFDNKKGKYHRNMTYWQIHPLMTLCYHCLISFLLLDVGSCRWGHLSTTEWAVCGPCYMYYTVGLSYSIPSGATFFPVLYHFKVYGQ